MNVLRFLIPVFWNRNSVLSLTVEANSADFVEIS